MNSLQKEAEVEVTDYYNTKIESHHVQLLMQRRLKLEVRLTLLHGPYAVNVSLRVAEHPMVAHIGLNSFLSAK